MKTQNIAAANIVGWFAQFHPSLFLVCRSWEAKRHFLDFLTAEFWIWVTFPLLDAFLKGVEYGNEAEVVLLPTPFWGLSYKRGPSDEASQQQCSRVHSWDSYVLRFMFQCQVTSSVNGKMPSSGGSDGSSNRITNFLVWLPDLQWFQVWTHASDGWLYHIVLGVISRGLV